MLKMYFGACNHKLVLRADICNDKLQSFVCVTHMRTHKNDTNSSIYIQKWETDFL